MTEGSKQTLLRGTWSNDMNDRKAIVVNEKERRAILESLRALRKNLPGGMDFDEVGELCERLDRPTITVVNRGPRDFMAFLNDDEGTRDCGQSPAEAVGRIVMGRSSELGIVIETDAKRQEPDATPTQTPVERAALADMLPGNWGCYDESPKAIDALNELGLKLIEAIRGNGPVLEIGVGTKEVTIADERLDAIRKAIRAIIDEQEVWSHCGAADTEGREAIWSLVNSACNGTSLDPQIVWDNCYTAVAYGYRSHW